MIETSKNITVGDTPAGVRVTPDAFVIPVLLEASSTVSPMAAGEALLGLYTAVESAVSDVVVEGLGYRSWTQRLAGKGVRGKGVRHRASAKVHVRQQFAPTVGFIERVHALELVRSALVPLEDELDVLVGQTRWVLSDPEAYRAQAVAQLHATVRALTEVFTVDVDALSGGAALQVEMVGPMSAYVRVDAEIKLRAPRPAAASS